MSTLEQRPVLTRLRFPLTRGRERYDLGLVLRHPAEGPTFQTVDMLAPLPGGVDPFAPLRHSLSELSPGVAAGFCGVMLASSKAQTPPITFTVEVLLGEQLARDADDDTDADAGVSDVPLGVHRGRRVAEVRARPLGAEMIELLTVTYTADTVAGTVLVGFGTAHVPDADVFLTLFDTIAASLTLTPGS